jgi:hypothetical protein
LAQPTSIHNSPASKVQADNPASLHPRLPGQARLPSGTEQVVLALADLAQSLQVHAAKPPSGRHTLLVWPATKPQLLPLGQSLVCRQTVAQKEPASPADAQTAGTAPAPLQLALLVQGAQSRTPKGAQ